MKYDFKTTNFKTQHRKLKIEQHRSLYKQRDISRESGILSTIVYLPLYPFTVMVAR
jgi:hypothetical protein